MTDREIIDYFLSSMGRKRIKGDSAAPLVPFLLMDLVYSTFRKYIAPMDLKFRAKQLREKWRTAYNQMNHAFFSVFNDEQQEYIIGRMDDMEKTLEHDLLILKIAVMERLNFEALEKQEIHAVLVMCNVLTQTAQHIWDTVYKGTHLCALAEIEHCTKNLTNEIYKVKERISLQDDMRITKAVDVLINRVITFMQ